MSKLMDANATTFQTNETPGFEQRAPGAAFCCLPFAFRFCDCCGGAEESLSSSAAFGTPTLRVNPQVQNIRGARP